jgi:predicted esterase
MPSIFALGCRSGAIMGLSAGRRTAIRLFVALVLSSACATAIAATCSTEDFTRHVNGESECLLMQRYGSQEPDTLLVWLHGDLSAGGPANDHFALAERSATIFADKNVMAVAIVRPGYPDGSGESSTAAFLHGGRADHYTKENLNQVGTAIERLKTHYKPRQVITIGQSGGAATVAVLLGMKPALIDGAILVSCPCDMTVWRQGRRPWVRSEDPVKWIGSISNATRVIALTGDRDSNAYPELAKRYVAALKARGIDASFKEVPGAEHNDAIRSEQVIAAIRELLGDH